MTDWLTIGIARRGEALHCTLTRVIDDVVSFPFLAYWLLHTVMNDARWELRRFYTSDLRGLLVSKFQFSFLFELYLPELYAHFQEECVHQDLFTEWFMTLFTFPSFPRRYPLLERLWDLMIVTGGTKYLHRVALGILHLSQPTLLQCSFEEIIAYLKSLPDDGILNPDVLLPLACDTFRVSNEALWELEKRFDADQKAKEEARKRRAEKAAARQKRDSEKQRS